MVSDPKFWDLYALLYYYDACRLMIAGTRFCGINNHLKVTKTRQGVNTVTATKRKGDQSRSPRAHAIAHDH